MRRFARWRSVRMFRGGAGQGRRTRHGAARQDVHDGACRGGAGAWLLSRPRDSRNVRRRSREAGALAIVTSAVRGALAEPVFAGVAIGVCVVLLMKAAARRPRSLGSGRCGMGGEEAASGMVRGSADVSCVVIVVSGGWSARCWRGGDCGVGISRRGGAFLLGKISGFHHLKFLDA